MTDEEKIIPICCWCEAPLKLDKHRNAWCTGRKECRDRQRACGMHIEKDGVKKWLFLPSPKQTVCMESQAPNLFIYGNRGGGKSVAMRWLCHQLAIAVPGFKYAILRTSFPELMKNHIENLENEMNLFGGEKLGFRYHKTDHICYYPNGSIGYYAQCANDADVKKILGAEVAMVIFDEAPTFEWEHMRLIAASIRVTEGSDLIPMTRYVGNPIGNSIDELWKHFVDKDVDLKNDPEYRPDEWEVIEIHVQDNPHLNAKQYWKQFSGLPAHYIKAWKEGIRVEEDALFEFLPKKDGKPYHVIREVPRITDSDGNRRPLFRVVNGVYDFPDWVKIYRAYDHGYYPDPAVCLWFAVYGNRILCFKEMTWYRVLSKDIAKEIVAESRGMRVVTTYCDPSLDVQDGSDAESIKDKFESNGVPMDNAINDRELFADAIHNLLADEVAPGVPRTQFIEKLCPNTVKYIPRMKYNERNPAAMADHKQDHWPVACAYFGMMKIPNTQPGKTNKPRRWMIPKSGKASSAARVMQRRLERAARM